MNQIYSHLVKHSLKTTSTHRFFTKSKNDSNYSPKYQVVRQKISIIYIHPVHYRKLFIIDLVVILLVILFVSSYLLTLIMWPECLNCMQLNIQDRIFKLRIRQENLLTDQQIHNSVSLLFLNIYTINLHLTNLFCF